MQSIPVGCDDEVHKPLSVKASNLIIDPLSSMGELPEGEKSHRSIGSCHRTNTYPRDCSASLSLSRHLSNEALKGIHKQRRHYSCKRRQLRNHPWTCLQIDCLTAALSLALSSFCLWLTLGSFYLTLRLVLALGSFCCYHLRFELGWPSFVDKLGLANRCSQRYHGTFGMIDST